MAVATFDSLHTALAYFKDVCMLATNISGWTCIPVSSFNAFTLLVGSFDPEKPVPNMTYNVSGGTLNISLSLVPCGWFLEPGLSSASAFFTSQP